MNETERAIKSGMRYAFHAALGKLVTEVGGYQMPDEHVDKLYDAWLRENPLGTNSPIMHFDEKTQRYILRGGTVTLEQIQEHNRRIDEKEAHETPEQKVRRYLGCK